ncbi:MAG: DUF2062 domain-containing protein [Deltaproteobacteria bacterium]|nr:DUF2062 domain-containing protein [Deltaproteobacteria bacterium]
MDNQQAGGWTGIGSRYRAIKNKIYCSVIQPLVASRNTPHHDALGVALGLIVGLGAPLGSHMLVLGLMRLGFKFNVIVAFGFTFVINPLNAVPMYYGYYLLGSFVVGEPASLNFEDFRKTISPVMDSEYFWESMLTFFRLSSAIFFRWLMAAISLAITFGTLAYGTTYYIQRKRLHKAALRLGLEYRNLVERLQTNGSESDASGQD